MKTPVLDSLFLCIRALFYIAPPMAASNSYFSRVILFVTFFVFVFYYYYYYYVEIK